MFQGRPKASHQHIKRKAKNPLLGRIWRSRRTRTTIGGIVEKMDAMFPGEVFSHLEFVRLDGNITCFGLPLVKFTSEARLDEIVRLHEENGCPIFNPHRYTLEEGGMKQTDAVQLAFKRETDPQGLLNPGKMIAWENPDYDYRSGQTFLFKGLQRVG